MEPLTDNQVKQLLEEIRLFLVHKAEVYDCADKVLKERIQGNKRKPNKIQAETDLIVSSERLGVFQKVVREYSIRVIIWIKEDGSFIVHPGINYISRHMGGYNGFNMNFTIVGKIENPYTKFLFLYRDQK